MKRPWWLVSIAGSVAVQWAATFLAFLYGETSPFEYGQMGRVFMLNLGLVVCVLLAGLFCVLAGSGAGMKAITNWGVGLLVAIPVLAVSFVFAFEYAGQLAFTLRGGQ